MARKLYCDNVRCKYHLTDRGCSKNKIEIDYRGCKSFEKGITFKDMGNTLRAEMYLKS